MSAATSAPTAASRGRDSPHGCAFCRASLEPDQEWCLECGAGRTIVHRAPDWRVPIALLSAIVLAGLIAFAIALINMAGTGTGISTASAPDPAPAGAAAHPAAPAIASWPSGLSGWTVILTAAANQGAARATAQRLAAGGMHVGVLYTGNHPRMHPHQTWEVFSGRYPDQAQAQAAAAKLTAAGQSSAAAHEVAGPGGI